MARMPFVYTAHAIVVMAERGIRREWVERVLTRPHQVQADRGDPSLQHATGPIAEHNDRVLRVVYNWHASPWRVVTAYFDRTLRGTP